MSNNQNYELEEFNNENNISEEQRNNHEEYNNIIDQFACFNLLISSIKNKSSLKNSESLKNEIQNYINTSYQCADCKEIPLIDFIDENNIKLNCKCNKNIEIEEYLKKIENNNDFQQSLCRTHKKEFDHYCYDCNKILCIECQTEHLNRNHNIEEYEIEVGNILELYNKILRKIIEKIYPNIINREDEIIKMRVEYNKFILSDYALNSDDFFEHSMLNDSKYHENLIKLPIYIRLINIILLNYNLKRNRNNISDLINIKNIYIFLHDKLIINYEGDYNSEKKICGKEQR